MFPRFVPPARAALFFLFAFALCVLNLPAQRAHGYAFESGAPQAILTDAATGAVLYSKNADIPVAPSSMTKLMTVYVIFDHIARGIIAPDDTVIVSEKAWKKGGSKMFLKHSERVTFEELLHGIIVQSGNDACIAAAEGIASDEAAFADIMNATAAQLGLTQSHFKNASGWPEEGHVMSVADIAELSARLIYDFPDKYPYFADKNYTHNGITQSNRNRLLHRDIGVDGLKTGHTEDGGYGIAVSAVQDGRRLVAVVNGLDSDRARIDEAEKLLQYGFRYYDNKTVFEQGGIVGEADVWLGAKATVKLQADRDIVVPVSKLEDGALPRMEIVYHGPVNAPVTAGTPLGELLIYRDGNVSASHPLSAAEDIGRASVGLRAVKRFVYFIKRKLAENRGASEEPAPAPAQ